MNLEVEQGKITCLLGRNGVGKTSLIRSIVGQHPPSGGTITFDGAALGKRSSHDRARSGIGLVPQGREIFPLLTVKENLQTGYAGLPSKDRNIPDYVFELFPILKTMLHRRGGDLSGGQQQRVAVARALVYEPKLVLMDEPLGRIDPPSRKRIIEALLREYRMGEQTILISTHLVDEIEELIEEVVFLREGEIALSGNSDELRSERNQSLCDIFEEVVS